MACTRSCISSRIHNLKYIPFENDWYNFLEYALIRCRTPKKQDRNRDIQKDKAYYRGTCYLTHKQFDREECYAMADGYIEKALQNDDRWNELFDRYEKYYKKA
jgi:hypothetical protein